jgi:hypothetical protein
MGKILGYVALASIIYLTFKQIKKAKENNNTPKVNK